MLRFSLILLTFLTFLPVAQGQLLGRIFHPRDRYCPDCDSSYTPRIPGVTPENEPADPELAAMEQIIPPECRVQNRGPNCGWCALEDVFVAAGYENFKGLRQRANEKRTNPHGIGVGAWKAQLEQAKVEYKLVTNKDYSIFDYAKQEGVGVAIFIPDHAIVCCGLNDRHAYILDNNGPLKVQRWTRAKFDRAWEGVACCPLFRKHKPKPDTPTPTPQPGVGPQSPAGPQGPPGASADLKPLTDQISGLATTTGKLVDTVGVLSKSVSDLGGKVVTIDNRLVAVEGKLSSSPTSGGTPSSLPSTSTVPADPRLDQVLSELQGLKAQLKNFGGTVNVSVVPVPKK